MSKPGDEKAGGGVVGAGRLAVDAVAGISHIVESVHRAALSGRPGRTRGISRFVYDSIRAITGLVGIGLEEVLSRLAPLLESSEGSPERDALIAALEGVLGDYLEETGNPLATDMKLRRGGRDLEAADLASMITDADGRLLLCIHGSCLSDLSWDRDGHNHGEALAEAGFAPVFLRYNSGLHISENGKRLSDLLEATITTETREIHVLAHSMGGLVMRSACSYATTDRRWPSLIEKIVYLGTPHHGALLEQGGNLIDRLLGVSAYSAPFAGLGKLRSAGITDLRFGVIREEDWQGRDRFDEPGDPRRPVPLPEGIAHYAIAATTSPEPGPIADGLIGDGLVTLDSALGRHLNPEFDLRFPPDRQWVGRNMGHFDLLDHVDVFRTLSKWLTEAFSDS